MFEFDDLTKELPSKMPKLFVIDSVKNKFGEQLENVVVFNEEKFPFQVEGESFGAGMFYTIKEKLFYKIRADEDMKEGIYEKNHENYKRYMNWYNQQKKRIITKAKKEGLEPVELERVKEVLEKRLL